MRKVGTGRAGIVIGLLLILVGAAVVSTGGEAARNGALTSAQRHELLQRYEPVVYYAGDEEWSPTKVNSFLDLARVESIDSKTGDWGPVKGPLPQSKPCGSKVVCLRLNLPCAMSRGVDCYRQRYSTATDWSHGYVYARLLDAPQSVSPPRGFTEKPRYVARFWFFYLLDDWHSRKKKLWQGHEGDWESVNFGLRADGSAIFAAYSQHCSGTVLPYDRVTKMQGHPVVYVALGSHANYYNQIPRATYPVTCPHHYTDANHFGRFLRTLKGILERDRLIDQMGSVHSYGPPGTSFSPLELIDLDSHPGSWETFPGTWGEKQYFWVENAAGKLPSVPFGNSPSATFTATTFDGFWHDTSD